MALRQFGGWVLLRHGLVDRKRSHARCAGPEVISRGWISDSETGPLVEECTAAVADALAHATNQGSAIDIEALQGTIRRTAGRFVKQRTKRYPMIVPVVVEV